MDESLGRRLRLAREERGLDIRTVAERTCIPSRILSAVENDDFSSLPGGGYSRGVVRYFAKEVGVDESEALILFEKHERREARLPVFSNRDVSNKDKKRKHPFIKPAAGILVALAVTIGVGLYFLQPTTTSNQADRLSAPIKEQTSGSDRPSQSPKAIPDTLTVLIEAKSQTVNLELGIDGREAEVTTLLSGSARDLAGSDQIEIGFLGSSWNLINMTVAGRIISLPESSLKDLNKNYVVLTVKKEDLPRIVSEGNIDQSRIQLKRLRAVAQASPSPAPSTTPSSDDTRRNEEPSGQATPIGGDG
jgi:cytoskeletal protein RodZ